MNNTRVKCYHEVEELIAVVKGFDFSNNPYQSYAFLSVYLKYNPNGRFYFFNIYENEKLVGIVPFECTFENRLLNVKKFRFIGYRDFNYEQYICRDEDMLKVHTIFMDYLNSLSYSVVLNIYDVNNANPFYDILIKTGVKKTSLQLYSCPCLHFCDDFDAFFTSVFTSSKKRTELKKFQRKLSELGNLKMINVCDKNSYDTNLKYINQIYKVHAERFAGVYATSFFGSPHMHAYYSELIKSLMYYEKGYLSLIVLDEVVIAFIFCLTNGVSLIDWIPAFDPAFARYSLGTVQYKMLFEEICNKGSYQLFDYSKGSSVYKRKWAKEETFNYQFIINLSDKNPFAFLLYCIDKMKFTFKVYLRRKGVLSWGKRTLGKLLTFIKPSQEKKPSVEIRTTNEILKDTFVLNYSTINTYPIEIREAVLSAIYQGKCVVKVSREEVVIAE